jgi:hypothetical protein
MLSESVLRELVKRTPLQRRLIEAAWPSLSTESRLAVIEAATGPGHGAVTPGYLVDLAQSDSAEIVRFWASLHAYFRRPPQNEIAAKIIGEITPEEAARTQRLEADPSELVRTAGNSGGLLSFSKLVGMPQLTRLVTIRMTGSPDTHSFAEFVEKAIAAGVSSKDVRECIEEYFAREDVYTELKELHADGWGEFRKEKGWELLWAIAAKADPLIGHGIVDRAAVSGKFWHLKQEAIEALPPNLLQSCLWRREDLFEKVRSNVRATPDKYGEDVVKSVRQFDEMLADFGTPTAEESEKARLENMSSRTEAVFESVQSLQDPLKELKDWAERATEDAANNRKVLEGVRSVGWLVAILLGFVLWFKH